jgi:glucoamylase
MFLAIHYSNTDNEICAYTYDIWYLIQCLFALAERRSVRSKGKKGRKPFMHLYLSRRKIGHWSFRFLLLVVLLVASMLVPRQAYASGTAPDGPGASSNWTPSNDTIEGTAATTGTTSDVWFTGYNGIIGEVFYPTADTANTTDLQFLVGDSGHTWVDEEKVATTSKAVLYKSRSLAWTVTNTATSGKYQIVKTIYTDPSRNSLIQQVTFTALTGTLSNYLLYTLYNPTMQNAGNHNTSSTQVYNGTTMLVTTDSSGNYASALAASIPYQSGMTSSGFVGVNDGWTDLKGSSNCGSGNCPDYSMNYTYDAANNGNTAQTGLLDLSDGGKINTSTATSETFDLVLSFGQGSGSSASMSSAESTLAGTLGDNFSTMLSNYVSQWNTFDNGLKSPPAVGNTQAIQQARQQEYYLAANVLKAAQDKQTGTFVAGLGTPWGDTNGDGDSGYHLVWERDMYEFSSALIVAGDTTDPTRAVEWAFNTQQQSDGHFPQNSYVNGTPYWAGIQMDEQAFPIILAWKLGITDSGNFTHIKNAANYIINHGPSTGQERWEENSGYSPSTIAAEIAGLVCAADIARVNGDTSDQTTWDNKADYWQGMVPNWTFTTNGSLDGKSDYFIRISPDGNPNDGSTITNANGGGTYNQNAVVDAGFLELVRQGVMPGDSPYITLSLPVIDTTISQTINGNQYWYRYNHDGYGEHSDGSNYNGTGIGRLWPILSGERGIYSIASGNSADASLTAMTAAENGSGMIPEQVWDNSAPAGYTSGTPTKSMNPLNWAMGEYITLLFSASSKTIADVPSIVYTRYVTNQYHPHAGNTIDYNSSQAQPGDALTIYYHGSLDGQSSVDLHWGYNNWNGISDVQMVKRSSDGFWQATISIPSGATTINMAFNNNNGTWDNNNSQNYNINV